MYKKNKVIAIRVTDFQYDIISSKAKDANLSLTSYLIRSAFQKNIIHVNDVGQLANELKHWGNNLNQLTMLANMGKISTVNLNECCEKLSQALDELRKITELHKKI